MARFRVGDTVYLHSEFCNDPYAYVSSLEVYEDLDTLLYCGLGIDFSGWLKRLSFEVVSAKGEFVQAKTVMLFQERTFMLYADEFILDKSASAANRARLKNMKLEKAGQMRLL